MALTKFSGEFEEREREKTYKEIESVKTARSNRILVLLFGVLFFLFIIPDIFINNDSRTVLILFSIRFSFFLLTLFFYLFYDSEKDFFKRYDLISIYGIIVSLSYLSILYFYEEPNIYIQSFGVILLILAFFNVITRWIYALAISLFIGTGFILVVYFRPESLARNELPAIIVYLLLIIIMSGSYAYRISVYRRLQYLDNLKLEKLSTIDSLTGAYNRLKFDQELDRWVKLADRYGHHFSVILLDLDGLKKINDRFGHLAGDRVLIELAKLTSDHMRDGDIFARWGGDEFVMLLPFADESSALSIVERLENAVAEYDFQVPCRISCSMGLASYNRGEDALDLINRADENLYKEKDGESLRLSEDKPVS